MQVLVLTLCGLVGIAASASTVTEAPWREPGQIVGGDYLKHGTLRYTAEGREIVGRNRTCFNNRPLYCPQRDPGNLVARRGYRADGRELDESDRAITTLAATSPSLPRLRSQ